MNKLQIAFRNRLQKQGLSESEINNIVRCVTFHQSSIVGEFIKSKIEIGASKFGGVPDLPEDMEWPSYDGDTHLAFIAQINITELKHLDLENHFPQHGIIYFFMALEEDGEGIIEDAFDIYPIDSKSFKVIYVDDTVQKIKKRKSPSDLTEYRKILKARKLIFSEGYDFYFDEDIFNAISKPVIEKAVESLYDLLAISPYQVRILGSPVMLQMNDPEQNWAKIYENKTGKLYIKQYPEFDDNKNIESGWYKPVLENFILLLQLPDWTEWGDGVYYYGIERQDLLDENFDFTTFHYEGT